MKTQFYRVLMIVLICLSFTKEAHAYLNPGAGSYVIQILIGSVMGALIVVRIYWRRIVVFFKNHFRNHLRP